MKLKSFFILILLPILFSACLIKSFNPFYLPEHAIIDDRIIGTWMDQENARWHFENYVPNGQKAKFPQYILQYNEEEGKTSRFLVTLFSIENDFYLDFFPDLEVLSEHELLALHTLPVHSLAKIEIADSYIEIKWFNEEWAYDLIASKKSAISHELIQFDADDATLVFTATTEELQRFIREFGDDPKAFDCDDKYSGDTFCRNLIKK